MTTLQLRKFNPASMPDDKVCIFIGKRGTGKSSLVTDILYHKRHIPAGIVMSGTEDGNHYYRDFVPDLFIYGSYDKETLEKVLQRQRKLINQNNANAKAFMLLDDCMYDNKFLKDTCIRECFMNGRHWKILFMLCLQYCMDLPPGLRTNVDYVFILRENIIQNRERLFKNFFGIFPTFDLFNKTMDVMTENYGCMVLDNTSKSNRIEDCVFWYKAPLRKPGSFRIGSPALWQFHAKVYNPDHRNTTPEMNKDKLKRGTAVTIVKRR